MNLRLEFELMLRRYGWRLVILLLLAVSAGIVTLIQFAPPTAPPAVVQASDGSRQLEMHHRAFRAVLIPRGELEARQGEVLDAVARHGLTVGHIAYAAENRAAGQFGLATLQMPLRGSYADLRAFIATVLAAQPALAVEDLAIQRNVLDSTVEARLKLAFFTETVAGSNR